MKLPLNESLLKLSFLNGFGRYSCRYFILLFLRWALRSDIVRRRSSNMNYYFSVTEFGSLGTALKLPKRLNSGFSCTSGLGLTSSPLVQELERFDSRWSSIFIFTIKSWFLVMVGEPLPSSSLWRLNEGWFNLRFVGILKGLSWPASCLSNYSIMPPSLFPLYCWSSSFSLVIWSVSSAVTISSSVISFFWLSTFCLYTLYFSVRILMTSLLRVMSRLNYLFVLPASSHF